jgi:hypothetical protein
MNSVLVGLVEHGDDGEIDPDTIIPMIDGGTEGLALSLRARGTSTPPRLMHGACRVVRRV